MAYSTVTASQYWRLNNINIHKLAIKGIYGIDRQNRNTDKGENELRHISDGVK